MPISPFSVLRGFVSRILPQANPDSPAVDVGVRVDRYGGLMVAAASPSDYSDAEEGSFITIRSPTIGTGQVNVAAQTAFSDTAPNFILVNNESTSSGVGKSIALRFIRLMSTHAMTASTIIQYVFTLDPYPRALSTNNLSWCGSGNVPTSIVTALQMSNANLSSPVPNFLFGTQDSATVSAIGARSSSAIIVARGNLGGLNQAGDIFQINFGQYDCGSSSAPTAAEGANQGGSRMYSEPPVLVPPGWTLVGHIWSPSSSASLAPEICVGLRAR